MGELGVQTHHVGPLELADEGQGVADRGQEDVAARLVGLRLEGDAQTEVLRSDVLAAEVDGLLVAVERGTDVLGRVGLDALPAAPHHVDLGAELGPELHRFARLPHGEAPDRRIVRREGALLEDGPPEEVGRRHRDLHPGLVEGGPEALEDGLRSVGDAS